MKQQQTLSPGQKLGRAITTVIAVLFVAAILYPIYGSGFEYSDGSRSGVVQKISRKGWIWKTWEGELNLGYANSRSSEYGTQINPAIFYFSVSDPAVAETVEAAERSGNRVTVEYKQYWLRGYRYGKTSYDVTGVVRGDDERAEVGS